MKTSASRFFLVQGFGCIRKVLFSSRQACVDMDEGGRKVLVLSNPRRGTRRSCDFGRCAIR